MSYFTLRDLSQSSISLQAIINGIMDFASILQIPFYLDLLLATVKW